MPQRMNCPRTEHLVEGRDRQAPALAVSSSSLCKAEAIPSQFHRRVKRYFKGNQCTLSRNAYKGHTMY